MGHIVFSEGKNDVLFVEAVLSDSGRIFDIDKFIIEELIKEEGGSALIPKETEKIRRFIARDDSGDVLLKSEGNRENLLKVFTTIVVDLCEYDLNYTLLIDGDGEEFQSIERRLNGHLGSRYGGHVSINEKSTMKVCSDITIVNCSVTGDAGLDDEFTALVFSDDLEAAAGITTENTRDEMDDKINDYAQDINNAEIVKLF